MAFNKRILEKINKACDGDEAMLAYINEIVKYEMGGAKHYTKDYERILKQYAKKEEDSK